jgi:hypothetical protein
MSRIRPVNECDRAAFEALMEARLDDQVMILQTPMWLSAGQTLALDSSACIDCETDSIVIYALTP